MSFTYYVIKNKDLYGKLKNDGSMYMVQNSPKYDDVSSKQPLSDDLFQFHF